MNSSYTPLEPSSLSSLGVTAPSFNGTADTFFTTSSFVYTLFFVAIVMAAFYKYAHAGILRMEGTEATIRKSNDMIKQVTLGLLGVFSLFLILFTVNKGLLTGDIGLSDLQAGRAAGATNTKPPAVNVPANNNDPVGWGAISADASVRSLLSGLPNGGIVVNKSVCNNPVQTNCTTVGGLPDSTITMLSNLRKDCSGTIAVTGGVEAGHQSHGPGLTPVDLSLSSPGGLEACIRSFPKGPAVSFCKVTYQKYGYTFCDENLGVTHWHVYVR